jgi:hypothetical protein
MIRARITYIYASGLLALAFASPQAAAREDPTPAVENALGVRTYGIMDCLTLPAVCEELKLTPEQLAQLRKKAKEIFNTYDRQEAGAVGREVQIGRDDRDVAGDTTAIVTHLKGLDRMQVFGFAMRAAAAATADVLTKEQYERLAQISRQRMGSLEELMRVASDGFKERLDARTAEEYRELQDKARRAKTLLEVEREFALRMGYRISVIDEMVRQKTIEVDAAYYQRLLDLLPRDFRKRWLDHIGPVTPALQTFPNYRHQCGSLYDVLLVAERSKGEIPFDPYLDLPDGKTTGKDYEDYPRSKRKKRR